MYERRLNQIEQKLDTILSAEERILRAIRESEARILAAVKGSTVPPNPSIVGLLKLGTPIPQ